MTNMKTFLLGIVLYISFTTESTGFIFPSPSWNTLRTTWGLRVWRSSVFQSMPLTKSAAITNGYEKLTTSTECKGTFLGYRYAIPGNPSVILLYDDNGYIAGIQSGFPKDLINPATLVEWFQISKLFVEDNTNGNITYTLTAYFVDPAIICNGGRNESQASDEPVGTELSFQTKGSTPETDIIKIPMYETDVQNGTGWTLGKCFRTMGVHYWYNMTSDMNCDNFFPAFLLYNRGKLTGFGWAVVSNFTFSDKYEHPPKEVFQKFMNPVPNCLYEKFDEAHGFTTMHHYMNVQPWNMAC